MLTSIAVPDRVTVWTEDGTRALTIHDDLWTSGDLEVGTILSGGDATLAVTLRAPSESVSRLHLRWNRPVAPGTRFLGDAWERGYGDLEWRGLVPERAMPWYVLARESSGRTHGLGVRTGAGSLAAWRVDAGGVSLWLDVRNGASGVRLGDRTLDAATVVLRPGTVDDASPFAAARAFCRRLCPNPRLPDHVVYGSNNWYYAYGRSSHDAILADADIVAAHASNPDNRPYMTIDAGWQPQSFVDGKWRDIICGGPYDRGGSEKFPDMPGLAAALVARGTRPGIWIRPLCAPPGTTESWLLPSARAKDASAMVPTYDPSIPEVRAQVAADFRQLASWGYRLIKHDWSACDVFGRWGFDMHLEMTNSGWHFADRTRTTAEIILDLYRAIREGAGDGVVVIGCNAVGHQGAGLFELHRTGDDTSGREWERTRKMGVNTLAFRMAQHDAFHAVDADCVGLTNEVPWEWNRQWLDLLARSGTPLFVSADPKALGPEQSRALRAAFDMASRPQTVGEPLDWLETTCPSRWNLGGEIVDYDWFGETGIEEI